MSVRAHRIAFNHVRRCPIGRNIAVATQDVSTTNRHSQTSSSFFGISLDNKASTERVQIGVGNKTELQGTEVQAKEIAFANTKADGTAGELILGGSTNTTQTSHTEKNETAGLYQEAKGQGSTTQTLNQTSLKGNVTFDAALKITAQIPKDQQSSAGAKQLAAQVQTLQGTLGASQSGLDYLNQLAANPNVKWEQIALANDKWSYDQAGLTPAGAALLSIAVAAATGGSASSLAGSLTSSTAGAGALTAGMTSLASQAAVAMVNNGGDIGKTLQQLGSEQSVKGLLTTMATAGALNALGSSSVFSGQSGPSSTLSNTSGIATSQAANAFQQNLLKNVTNNLAGSAIDAAINGKSLDEKALSSALSNALITAGMASGAQQIGDARVDGNAAAGTSSTLNNFTAQIAHAVLGCAGGAAMGGGCGAGAVGAVVGELTAEYAKANNMTDSQALALAKTLAAATGVLAGGGGDNVAAVNTAAMTGANAAENNYLKHAEALRLSKLQQQLDTNTCDTQCKRDIADLKALDTARNDKLAACEGVTSTSCNTARQEVRVAAAEYVRKNVSALSTLGDLSNTYQREKAETLSLADGTLNGKALGAAQGLVGTLAEGAIGLGKFAMNLFGSAGGDAQSAQALREGAGAAYDFVKDTSNWPQLLGAMSPADREKLAQAYERGDGNAVGKLLGASLANLPITGGGMVGSIAKVDKATTLAADAAKLTGKVDLLDSNALYSSKAARADLEATYGAENVTSTTVANNPVQRVNSNPAKGVEVVANESGKAVVVTYVDPLSGKAATANIPYDSRGLPVFDDASKFTTKIDMSVPYEQQFSKATQDLRDAINSGKVDGSQFTAAQLQDIQSGRKTIDGLTWHHNAQAAPNNMQLVPNEVHSAVTHLGQGSLAGGK